MRLWEREQDRLTGELTKSAGDKKSHLPSGGVRCDRRGRVKAQAPAKDTAQDGHSEREKNRGEKKREEEREGERRLTITMARRESRTKTDAGSYDSPATQTFQSHPHVDTRLMSF